MQCTGQDEFEYSVGLRRAVSRRGSMEDAGIGVFLRKRIRPHKDVSLNAAASCARCKQPHRLGSTARPRAEM
jgi:hypothetical protein